MTMTESGIIELYHGGTEAIINPDCTVGREGLDFGRGFYLTDIYDQAVSWANTQGLRRHLRPVLNVYTFNREAMLEEARTRIFRDYGEEWLDFIVDCRSGGTIWKDYDYIEGGVADDRVIDTVNLYIQGYYPKELALERLRFLKPNNQICIINQSLMNRHLTFTDCIKL